jgi:hypothetical protein
MSSRMSPDDGAVVHSVYGDITLCDIYDTEFSCWRRVRRVRKKIITCFACLCRIQRVHHTSKRVGIVCDKRSGSRV